MQAAATLVPQAVLPPAVLSRRNWATPRLLYRSIAIDYRTLYIYIYIYTALEQDAVNAVEYARRPVSMTS